MSMWLLKKSYAICLKSMEVLFGIERAKIFDTSLRFHKKLNLREPKTLSDKVSYIELHEQSELAAECTDKFAVRNYVKSRGLEEILIPAVGGPWNSVEQIDFSLLPNKYVLKATHGCKMNYVVKDNTNLNESECKETLRQWLKVTYGTYSVEPHYRMIPHRIYAEQFLDGIDDLVDYKIHCCNGKPQFILTCSNRKSSRNDPMSVTLDLFDLEWHHLSGIVGYGSEVAGDGSLPRPAQLKQMLEIAEKLAGNIKFVRIDLYELGGQIFFGEMTFSPACCVFPYFSKEFDLEMGKRLIL